VFSEADPDPLTQGSGRLRVAEDIVNQPIAMRVIANRIWKGQFDTGIVDTPSNFGQMGERPSNPELLEYLTSTFVKGGLSVKKTAIVKSMLTFRLSVEHPRMTEAKLAKDSGNRL